MARSLKNKNMTTQILSKRSKTYYLNEILDTYGSVLSEAIKDLDFQGWWHQKQKRWNNKSGLEILEEIQNHICKIN